MFYNQYGSSPGGDEAYESGTEEEYDKAVVFKEDDGKNMREVVPFFKEPSEGELRSPGAELTKVLEFKSRISEWCQYIEFSNDAELRGEFEKHLEEWLRMMSSRGLAERPPRDVFDYAPPEPVS